MIEPVGRGTTALTAVCSAFLLPMPIRKQCKAKAHMKDVLMVSICSHLLDLQEYIIVQQRADG